MSCVMLHFVVTLCGVLSHVMSIVSCHVTSLEYYTIIIMWKLCWISDFRILYSCHVISFLHTIPIYCGLSV